MKSLVAAILFISFGHTLALADVTIKGSNLLATKLLPELVEAYQKEFPSIKFKITSEGSTKGLQALFNRNCDIALASRQVTDTESKKIKSVGIRLDEHIVAHHMIAVILNPKNAVQNLSLKQVEQIFSGQIKNWDTLGGKGQIEAIKRNSSSGIYKEFQKLAMNHKQYGENIQNLSGGKTLYSAIANGNKAISYCGIAYADKKIVKVISIEGIEPKPANVNDYPITRNLYFYTVEDTKPRAKAFIVWVKNSKNARTIISNNGFIPSKPK